MTIVLTGGGSGGHITPILAVAAKLKQLQPDSKIIYIGQIGDPFSKIAASDPSIDKSFSIRAGKWRRFHGEGLKQLLQIPDLVKNIRDFFYVFIGTIQSWRLTKHLKPDVVFSRGGYISIPVALGANLNQIPYITHDSDSVPSLANRLIARWATLHAVALPKEIYPYALDKTISTGIPLNDKFAPVNKELINKYRQEIKIPPNAKLLLIIGGGLGSQILNNAALSIVPHLVKENRDLYVVQIAGQKNDYKVEEQYKQLLSSEEKGRVRIFGYINDVYKYSGAADLIVSRAGATNLAEFALQGKACIIIPSSFLVGGHQLKNAQYLEEKGAAIVIAETDLIEDPNRLAKQVSEMVQNKDKRAKLEAEISKFAVPNAADKLAHLILDVGNKNETSQD